MKTLKWLVAALVSLFVGFNAGAATITLEVQSSANMNSWVSTGIQVAVPVTPGVNQFYRLKVGQVFSSATVTVAGSGIDQNITIGAPGQFLGQFTVAVSGEPVAFNNITLLTGKTNIITNVSLYDASGAVVAGPVDSVDGTILFTDTVIFPMGTNGYVIKGKVSGSFVDGDKFSLTTVPANHWRGGIGASSGTSVTVGPSQAVAGPIVTVKRVTFTVSTNPSSYPQQLAAAGEVGVASVMANFRATGSARLTQVGLKLTSGSPRDIAQVTIWQGATQIGYTVFIGTSTQAVALLPASLLLPNDTDVTFTVKFDLENICAACPVTESGHLVAVDIDPSTTKVVSVATGEMITATGGTASAGVRVVKSYPGFALMPLSSSGVSDGRLIRFSVSASPAGPISIAKLAVKVATSAALVNGLGLYCYTDPNYTSAAPGTQSGGLVGLNATIVSSGTNATIPFEVWKEVDRSFVLIPAGMTYYFEFRSGGVMASGPLSSVVTTLLGDAVSVQMSTAYALLGGNVIWSPNSITTADWPTIDWSNGYGLYGLPASGIQQVRIQ